MKLKKTVLKSINKHNLFGRLSRDYVFQVSATLISTGMLQVVIYPLLAKMLGANQYGILLTVMSVVNIITAALGSELGYTRLIKDEEYRERKISGDFNLFLLITLGLAPCAFIVVNYFMFHLTAYYVLLLSLLCDLVIIKGYFAVSFRLFLNFKHILFTNIFAAAGYLLGLLLVRIGCPWPVTYISAEILSLVYVIYHTSLWKEPFKRSSLFSKTGKTFTILILSAILGNTLTYFDKLIIYPILGAESVTIYFAAAFFGKSISLLVGPASAVFLSYISAGELSVSRVKFIKINFVLLLLSGIFALMSILLAFPVTSLLYPDIVGAARKYMFIANLAAVVTIINSINSMIILKIAPSYWQIILPLFAIAVYIIGGYFSLDLYGIMGFCYAMLAANILVVFVSLIVGLKYCKR